MSPRPVGPGGRGPLHSFVKGRFGFIGPVGTETVVGPLDWRRNS